MAVVVVLVSCCMPAVHSVASPLTNPLGPYSISDITVSGLSSGGFMAVQLHVSLSSLINGSAVFAGVSTKHTILSYLPIAVN